MPCLAPTPVREEHFRLFFLSAVQSLLGHLEATLGSRDAAERQFPFLAGYESALARFGGAIRDLSATMAAFEARASAALPLARLRDAAALTNDDLVLLATIGLPEEDARFGFVFEALHGIAGQQRATAGLVQDWATRRGVGGARAALRKLGEQGLVTTSNQDAARAQWGLQVVPAIWDAMRGEAADAPWPWARHHLLEKLTPLGALVLAPEARVHIERLPSLIEAGEATAIVLRGPRHNGRRTVAGALARAVGAGTLVIESPGKPEEQRLRAAGAFCTLVGALPVVVLDLAAGEVADLELPPAYDGPLIVVMGRQGGAIGRAVERAVTVSLDLPGMAERREHFRAALPSQSEESIEPLAGSLRMASGNLRAAARMARSYALLASGADPVSVVTVADVRSAARSLHRPALETLTTRLPSEGDWSHLSVGAETRQELDQLTVRCRAREELGRELGAAFGGKLGSGLRALFQGPSGTGKTLAAKILAATIGKDIHRLEVSAVVNKYIGETEKNLARVFELAEELDVVLLLDEGDALLARRTGVRNSTDRYANLETNYLLQRFETFDGILIVTTNAGDLIDTAFQRRMDVVVDFRPPDVNERMRLWQLHLPPSHGVTAALLREVASRCLLSGGQIRNAVVHARVLAFDESEGVADGHLVAAVQREYRRSGGLCPLRAR
jgi:hypothetical protein